MAIFEQRGFALKHMMLALSVLAAQPFSAAVADEAQEQDAQKIYSVDEFVREYDMKGMLLSPNGQQLAFTMPYKDKILLTVGSFIEGKFQAATRMPFKQDAYPMDVRWATDERLVFTLRQKTKVRSTKYYTWSEVLMSMKSDGSELRVLRTDGRKKGSYKHIDNADIVSLLKDDADHILISKSRRNNWLQEFEKGAIDDVHKLNIKTGDLSLYMKGPKIDRFKFSEWFADHKGHIRFGLGTDEDENSVMIIRGRGDDDWKVLSDNELFEEGKFAPLQFGLEDNEFYVLSSLPTGRMAVYRFDIASGTLGDLVYGHDEFDVTSIEYSFDKGKVVAARYNDGGYKIDYLDDDYGKLRSRIEKALNTGFSLWSISDDDQAMIVLASDERDAGSFYYYDVPGKNLTYLGSRFTNLLPTQMAEMESVNYDTRDGLTINGIMTKPRKHDGKPLPFIVLPHTYPNGRDSLEWDRTVQFLANRGYGVFQPNYRGSHGFGERFRALGRGEWGRDMQNDLVDGTEWLVDEGHAAEGQICIMGRGYAGYAALMGIAKEGDLFSCAIVRDAPVDVWKMLRDEDATSEGDDEYQQVAGDLKKKELATISPTNFVSDIEQPIFLYHHERAYYDIKHARTFVKSLIKAKKPIDYMEIERQSGVNLYDATEDDLRFLKLVEGWLLKENPTPLLKVAHKDGKVAAMPSLTQSGR